MDCRLLVDKNTDIFSTQNLTGQVLEAAKEEYTVNRTGPLTATLIEAITYLPLEHLTETWPSVLTDISSADTSAYLPCNYTKELLDGYALQVASILRSLNTSSEGIIEIMADSVGALQVSLQHPFSRGTVRPRSPDIRHGVRVDPRYGAHPFDMDVLIMGLQWNQKLIMTSAMRALEPNPDERLMSNNSTTLLSLAKAETGTGFHPCGTAAMLPRKYGGVVDRELKVYGVQNLRIVDASIIPLIPSAHLQSVVYAIAEKVSYFSTYPRCASLDGSARSLIFFPKGADIIRSQGKKMNEPTSGSG